MANSALTTKDYDRTLAQLQLSQQEAAYVPLSTTAAQACANCRFFVCEGSCMLVRSAPVPIRVTGWCNRWEAIPVVPDDDEMEGDDDTGEMEPEVDVEIEAAERAGKSPGGGLLERAMNALIPRAAEPFTGFKAVGNRWFAVWSNNFVDRDGELFTAKALDDYVARVDSGKTPMPELWFWHMSIRAGKAAVVARHGHMMIAAGTFDDTPTGRAFRDFYATTKMRFGVSHGFLYPRGAKQNGTYHHFTTFEISPLPQSAAANQFTEFVGGKTMVTPEKRALLDEMFGKKRADELLREAERAGEEVKSAGVAYKETTLEDVQARADIAALSADVKELVTALKALAKPEPTAPAAAAPAPAQDIAALQDAVVAKVFVKLNEQLPGWLDSAVKAAVTANMTGLAPRAAQTTPGTKAGADDPVLRQYVAEQQRIEGAPPMTEAERLKRAIWGDVK